MNRDRKKTLKSEWREQERLDFLAQLPLSVRDLRALFDMLDTEVPRKGCDHTRQLTRTWLTARGHNPEPIFAWLDNHGAFCDCEILANMEQKVEDASRSQTNRPKRS